MRLESDKHFLGGLDSARLGTYLEEPARTFHCAFGAVKIGAAEGPRGALDYVLRQGDEKARADELEYVAGDGDAVLRAGEVIEGAARVRRGPTAERILAKQTVELPAAASAAQRRAAADAIVADWAKRGHAAVAAVHGNGLVQPHLHVLAAARPVSDAGEVDRARGLWIGKQAVRDERRRVAELINTACRQEVKFHPGRLIDTGITRPAKKRIPQAAWQRGQRERDPLEVERVREEARRVDLNVPLDDKEVVAIVRQVSGVRYDREKRHFWISRDHGNAEELVRLVGVAETPSPSRPSRRELEQSERRAASRLAETEAELAAAVAGRERAQAELRALSESQRAFLSDVHEEAVRELPDLDSEAGRVAAWAFVRERRSRSTSPADAPYTGLSDRDLRGAWKTQGSTMRIAELDLEQTAPDHPQHAAARRRLEAARATREFIRREAERRGLELEPRRSRSRGIDDEGQRGR